MGRKNTVRFRFCANIATRPIGKMASVCKNISEQSLGYTAAVRGTYGSSTSSDKDYEYNHATMHERSRGASPRKDYKYCSCRATRARTKRSRRSAHPARVFRGYASYESTQQPAAVSHRAGLVCLVTKNATWSASARLFAARLESVRTGSDAWVRGRAYCTRCVSSRRQTQQ